jgi:hypothetical protein
MDDTVRASEEAVIKEVDASLKRLVKTWAALKRSRKELDFKTATQVLNAPGQELQQLGDRWEQVQATLQEGIQTDQAFVASDAYPQAIEQALKDAGVPIKGEYPVYEFPPFKLTFTSDTIRLGMGRRSQQIRAFAPDQVAAWVAREYRRVIDSKFDANRFCRELLSAYELLNQLSVKADQTLWGHSIPLKDIYRLLTLRQSSRQDYPEPLFTYDLARLKEQPEIFYESYQFELAPSRNQASSFLLVNSRGQESRVSNLVIYQKEG